MHVKTEISTVRVFKDGDSYTNKSEPIFSCTLHYISDTEVYLCNAVGDGKTAFRKLLKHLGSNGIALLRYERHGVMKEINLTRYSKTSCQMDEKLI